MLHDKFLELSFEFGRNLDPVHDVELKLAVADVKIEKVRAERVKIRGKCLQEIGPLFEIGARRIEEIEDLAEAL